jgi:hypothetical protein
MNIYRDNAVSVYSESCFVNKDNVLNEMVFLDADPAQIKGIMIN